MKIELMNVSRQYLEHKKEFDNVTGKILESGKYIGGDVIKEFEEKFAQKNGSKFCVSCGNGTDALVLALRALNIGVGDEVITVGFTFFATAESISAVGATPVFIDVEKDTFCMNADLIEKAITHKTKAILPVHIYGNMANMDKICSIAKKHNLFVIEDCAQSTFSTLNGKKAGTFGDIGCFSFFPTKILGCAGDGGAIITDNAKYAETIRSLKVHGSGAGGYNALKNEYCARNKHGFDKIIKVDDKYHNYLIGYNSRLDSIQAGILLVKMNYIDDYINKRIKNASYYTEKLASKYILQNSTKGCINTYYVFALVTDKRDDLMGKLINNGIETHTYYPVPLHLQPAYAYLGYKKGDLPETEFLCNHSLAIPVFPELTKEEIDYVIKNL